LGDEGEKVSIRRALPSYPVQRGPPSSLGTPPPQSAQQAERPQTVAPIAGNRKACGTLALARQLRHGWPNELVSAWTP